MNDRTRPAGEEGRPANSMVTLPLPGELRFRVRLHDGDGEMLRHFSPRGSVELWIEASEQPIDASGADDLKLVILPLGFPNYEIGRIHADAIAGALAALKLAIEAAEQAANQPIPTRDDGHKHVIRFARYSRKMPYVAMCEICMEELVPDVNGWAREHGLMEGHPGTYVGLTNAATIKEALEREVNSW